MSTRGFADGCLARVVQRPQVSNEGCAEGARNVTSQAVSSLVRALRLSPIPVLNIVHSARCRYVVYFGVTVLDFWREFLVQWEISKHLVQDLVEGCVRILKNSRREPTEHAPRKCGWSRNFSRVLKFSEFRVFRALDVTWGASIRRRSDRGLQVAI